MELMKDWKKRVALRPANPDLIDQLLPDGTDYMLIAGRAGIGKTILALQLAFCIATGEAFFGFPCKRVAVGYLSFEGSDYKLMKRIELIEQNFPDPGDYLSVQVGGLFRLPTQPQKFRDAASGLRVLIIDPLRYMVQHDYCKPEHAMQFTTSLQSLSQTEKVAVVLVHHIRKPHQNLLIEPGDLDSIKGATDYVDAATTTLLMERSRQSRGWHGYFTSANPDETTLHFAKTRDAIADISPKTLKLNRSKLLFEEV